MRLDLRERRKAMNRRLVALKHHIREFDDPVHEALQVRDFEFPRDLRASEAEIISITVALAQMDRGQYGVCVVCGDRISRTRLDRLPFTPRCDNCAREGH